MAPTAKHRIGAAFGSMPFGAGMNLTFIDWEKHDADAVLLVVASNLEKMREYLKAHAETHQENFSKLLSLQQDIQAFRRVLGIVPQQQEPNPSLDQRDSKRRIRQMANTTEKLHTPLFRVEGHVSISQGIAHLPDGTAIDLVKEAEVIQRVINLSRHPMFNEPDTDELPAWNAAITDLGKIVQDYYE